MSKHSYLGLIITVPFQLLASDDEEDSENFENEDRGNKITINRKFAVKYDSDKRTKELRRAKEVLDDYDEDDSEENESEDEDGDALSSALDLKIIRTINSLKKKDPKIYDNSTNWFDDNEEDIGVEEDNVDNNKLMSKKKYKDVLREQLLEHGADIEKEDGIHKLQEGRKRSTLLYDQEQKSLREDILRSIGDGAGNDDDEDDILTVRKKSSAQLAEEEEELRAALLEMAKLSAVTGTSGGGSSTSSGGDTSKGAVNTDAFLLDYMMKQKWRDVESYADDPEDEDYDDEEQELDRVDNFESKYNFRFEELADAGYDGASASASRIVGHARTVDGSVRRDDETRRKQREARKARKEHEMRQKEAEIRRLKNLKREEIRERLRKIGEVGGVSKVALAEEVLDEEWDPEKHEAQMNAQFGDEYYEAEDGGFDIDAEGGDAVDWNEFGGQYDENDDDDGGWGGDGDGDGGEGNNYDEEAEEDPEVAQRIEEELYKLDYEDVVADLPCRFKYREVPAESFGLSTDDILWAEDDELNKYVSLKKLSTYRERKTDREKEAASLAKKRKRLRATLRERKDVVAAVAVVVGDDSVEGDLSPVVNKDKSEEVNVTVNDKKGRKRKRKRVAQDASSSSLSLSQSLSPSDPTIVGVPKSTPVTVVHPVEVLSRGSSSSKDKAAAAASSSSKSRNKRVKSKVKISGGGGNPATSVDKNKKSDRFSLYS
eukprot:gene5752-11627_t